jgi:hypothetical protein
MASMAKEAKGMKAAKDGTPRFEGATSLATKISSLAVYLSWVDPIRGQFRQGINRKLEGLVLTHQAYRLFPTIPLPKIP